MPFFQCLPRVVQEQVPVLHFLLLAQVVPHVPQFLLSVSMSTHWPAQQLFPVPQAAPHLLQFLLSVCRSAQAPLQLV